MKFITPIYHPNVDSEGRICKDLIGEDKWCIKNKIRGIIESICTFLMSPVLDGQVNLEASNLYKNDIN